MSKEKHPAPTHEELASLANRLVEEQTTMTLATAKGNEAWSAPVYYVNQGFDFYFFSDPESRHIQESMQSGQASASIHAPASSWRDIRGIQMSGKIERLAPGLQAARVLRTYLKRYPFTEEFFEPGQRIDISSLFKRFRVRLYRFRPDFLYYLDNSIRFGFRDLVKLGPAEGRGDGKTE